MNDQPRIEMIPIDKIRVFNPRSRNRKKFNEIVRNISNLGLKKPIKVSVRSEDTDDDGYDLVCGQGRLEAFVVLGQTAIPAVVVDVSPEERLLDSLIENLARRNLRNMELVREIKRLKALNYSTSEIAQKIDLHRTNVAGILRLLRNGEEGLLKAVDRGKIPVNIAVQIAASDDEGVQKALAEAYEKKQLKGKAVRTALKIIEQRRTYGKTLRSSVRDHQKKILSSEAVVRAYNQEAERQRVLIRKARACETYLVFIVNALRQLFQDEKFVLLLQQESLDSLPTYLAEQVWR